MTGLGICLLVDLVVTAAFIELLRGYGTKARTGSPRVNDVTYEPVERVI